jgi:hypothetical protein
LIDAGAAIRCVHALLRNKIGPPGFITVPFRKRTCFPFPPSPRARSTRGICVDRISSRPCFAGYFNSIQKPMPRYYFHFRAGSSTLKDEVGEVLADASSALQHAKRIALELVRGGESTNASIIVAEGDRPLFEVPLSELGN